MSPRSLALPINCRMGRKTLDELSHATSANAATLRLLMYALSTIDIFAETADGRFCLTPLAGYLRSDTPYSQRGWALSQAQIGYRAWAELLHTVTSGQPAFEHIFGARYYDYMAQHPEVAAEWDYSMDQTAREWLGALAASYDFTPIQTIVDVGGGHGATLANILKDIPTMRGILFDLPHVVAGAGSLLAEAGVAERCEVIGGDMFAEVPSGGDAYLIARVLFNWDDQHARALLQSCRRAIGPQREAACDRYCRCGRRQAESRRIWRPESPAALRWSPAHRGGISRAVRFWRALRLRGSCQLNRTSS